MAVLYTQILIHMLESMFATPQPKVIGEPIEAIEAIIAAIYECIGHYAPARDWLYGELAKLIDSKKQLGAESYRDLQESTKALT